MKLGETSGTDIIFMELFYNNLSFIISLKQAKHIIQLIKAMKSNYVV